MTLIERIIYALLAGLVAGAVTYAVSYAIKTPVIWPGTIMAFSLTTATFLYHLGRIQ